MSVRIFKAPGRINIIGEHTDYNDGFVLPFAVDRYVWAEIEENEEFEVISEEFNEKRVFKSPEKSGTWADYIMGVVWAFERKGYRVKPLRIRIHSNLPIGAGLSSSAALEVAVTYGISKVMNFNIDGMEIVRIARSSEVEFVGVRCGIMDQFTAVFAKKDHAIFLDTMDLSYEYIPLNLEGYEIHLIDSKVKHELASSEYNKRRQECEKVLKVLKKRSFREIDKEDLTKLEGVLFKRAKHVLDENERVRESVEALKRGDMAKLGELLVQSHESLRDLYEVSCKEIDFIVDFLVNKDGILGARMVGGGFGGGVIVFSKEGTFPEHEKALKAAYKRRFGRDLEVLEVRSSDGVMEVEEN
ncbi:MAG: galactokinase [Thermotogaceae bacterium]|nr:galactokinase [Thermotogaceae bacterium]